MKFKMHDVVVYRSSSSAIRVGAIGRVVHVYPLVGRNTDVDTYNVDFGSLGGLFTIYGHELELADLVAADPIVAAKVEAVEACIETVESRIATAKACRYSEAYVAGMEDVLIFHRATLERVKRGEGYHPSTPVCGQGEQK